MKILINTLRAAGVAVVLLGLAFASTAQTRNSAGFHRAGGEAPDFCGEHQHHPEADDR